MKGFFLACLLSVSVWATQSSVYVAEFNSSIDKVEESLLAQFKKDKINVVWQLDILEQFKKHGLDKKLGKKFNTQNVSAVRTMVACNGKIGNALVSTDHHMMGYCPIRVTMTEKDGVTSVLFVRPSVGTSASKAHKVLVKMEKKVINSIQDSMAK